MSNTVTFAGIEAARLALREFFDHSPVRHYPAIDREVGHLVRVLVKHDNHLPANTFKVRNATAALLRLDSDARRRGVIAASTGNHGQWLAWAGARLGVPVTVCVPIGNNPEKNAAVRAMGARLVEAGATYDECIGACARIAADEGLAFVHSTNNASVIAGAATLCAEFLEQAPELDTLALALGGGSQCVGALIVRDACAPTLQVIAAQSEGATEQHDASHEGRPRAGERVSTFAEGIACGSTYDFTFDRLRAGLSDFVLVSDAEIASGIRDLWRLTHNMAEGAGAVSYAAVRRYAERFVMCGGNLDSETARRVLANEL